MWSVRGKWSSRIHESGIRFWWRDGIGGVGGVSNWSRGVEGGKRGVVSCSLEMVWIGTGNVNERACEMTSWNGNKECVLFHSFVLTMSLKKTY